MNKNTVVMTFHYTAIEAEEQEANITGLHCLVHRVCRGVVLRGSCPRRFKFVHGYSLYDPGADCLRNLRKRRKMMVAIGTAEVNFDKMFENAYDDLLDEFKNKTVWKHLYSIWGKSQQDDEFKTASTGHDNFFVTLLKHFSFDLKSPEEVMAEFTDNWKYPRLMVEKQHEHFRCLYADDVMTIVTLGGLGSTFTVPSKYVSVTLFADYDNLSSPEREALANAGNASGAVAKPTSGLTVTSAKENLASMWMKSENSKIRSKRCKKSFKRGSPSLWLICR